MFNKRSFLVFAGLLVAGTSFGQSTVQPCGTDEHYHKLMELHPEYAAYEQQFNEQLGSVLVAARGTAAGDDTVHYDVPLVVHVVHDYGFTDYLNDDDIYDAAAEWALAFVKKNSDTATVIDPFIAYIGNARIRFHLATIDPNGNPTKGVVRHYSYLTTGGSDQSKFDPWPNNKYMNIWFTNTLGTSGAAAYAYYPSSAAFQPHYDGVISLASYLNTSKTIPHELGHCLNLQHVWGNTNNPAVACGDDQVDDTPPTKGHNPGCVSVALFDTACATGYAKTYTSMSGLMDSVVNYPDTVNSQNIMDYTYCSNMFTIGQCFRMRTALTSSTAGRNNLITPANLAATGALAPMPDLPPVADFTYNKGVGGGTITDPRSRFLTFDNAASFSFKNASWNDTITSVNWVFTNGASAPTSTATSNVTNRFSMPGWVTVSLTATSNAGSNTIVRTNAVYAADTTPVGTIGYTQSFASEAAVLNWPMINYYENNFKWEYYSTAGKDGNGCVRFRSFDGSNRRTGTANGDYDDFITPAFNLEGVSGDLYFNFYTAAAATNPGGFGVTRVPDSLEVLVSTNGGARWTRISSIKSTMIADNGTSGTEFIPGASATWTGRSVTVAPSYRSRQTFFKFRYRPGNAGNNLYLDNMSLHNHATDVQELAAGGKDKFIIQPNPSTNGANLIFKSGNDGRVTYTVSDIAGKVVYKTSKMVTPNSLVTEFIGREVVSTPGMYIVTLTTGEMSATQKMVVN